MLVVCMFDRPSHKPSAGKHKNCHIVTSPYKICSPNTYSYSEAMDEHNVHNFWGASPFVDLGALAVQAAPGPPVPAEQDVPQPAAVALDGLTLDEEAPFKMLQVSLARAAQHTSLQSCPMYTCLITLGMGSFVPSS
jgi:hypothetical protein